MAQTRSEEPTNRGFAGATSPSPATMELLMQIAGGSLLPRSLQVIAELGIADAVGDRPLSIADVAAKAGVDAQALARTLRLLSAHGVFEVRDGSVSHNASSRLLRADHPQSLRSFVQMLGLPLNLEAYQLFGETLRSGTPAIARTHPEGVFGYLAAHPDEARIFGAAMTAKAHAQIGGIVAAYDFSRFQSIADIGGGRGHLLQAVLGRAPKSRGVLFDLPHVIEEAKDLASDRLALRAGDFFRDRLPSCDAYLLMDIIHDWDDARAAAILEAIRAAAPDGATVLLLETIVPDEPGPHWAKTLDVLMLAITGGLQRTVEQYEELFRRTGFRLRQVTPISSGLSIVEAAVAR
jgi:hypothetical protein